MCTGPAKSDKIGQSDAAKGTLRTLSVAKVPFAA